MVGKFASEFSGEIINLFEAVKSTEESVATYLRLSTNAGFNMVQYGEVETFFNTCFKASSILTSN